MKISKEYGPQFDATDGTIGDLKLVKRYVVIRTETGGMFDHRQGRYTFADREGAENRRDALVSGNRPDHIGGELGVGVRWCYPGHFDPAGPVEGE